MTKFYSIDDIRRHNENKGKNFFTPGAMRFFSSRVADRIHPGGVFVTSEKGPNGVRRYTVRQIEVATGSIATVGEFQQYASGRAAHAAAEAYTKAQGYVW